MLIQLLSDLHLETESFEATPAPGADLLVLAGDIDAGHEALEHFRGWPVPVVFVPGNHEFDGRDVDQALDALRNRCARLGIQMLHRETTVLAAGTRRVRFVAAIGWSDFDLLGPHNRERCMRAATYFLQMVQRSTRNGEPFDARLVREEGLRDRACLERELALERSGAQWDETVVITHFAPSARSVDPRYGLQPSSASFCNVQDDLMGRAGLWIHGHVHHPVDYELAGTRVRCNARGHSARNESARFEAHCLLKV
jgi:predicted phosphodiesterase